MTGSLLARGLRALELLAAAPRGLPLQEIADRLVTAKSGAHRLLAEFVREGYVRQDSDTGRYALTMKLVSIGFRHLAETGVADAAQPTLDGLARETGELARLAVVDGDDLIFAVKAQGARAGLRYDPDMGQPAPLFCTSTGQAYLACFDDAEALDRVARQGLDTLSGFGPGAPRTAETLLACLAEGRRRGYSVVIDGIAAGTAAIAAPVRHPGTGRPLGVVSVAGPTVRLDETRLRSFAGPLQAAAAALSDLSAGSAWLSDGVDRAPERENRRA